mgnify:CR=1 FL=1
MDKNATDIIKQNYIDYAIYSMKAKSYPSVYDGLTEVRRRCLVGAYTDAPATSMVKLSTMAAYALCYHPHSSDGIAEVIVNMTSKYTCPFPFFDGRGNFGDLNNPASAPRYLECILNKNARRLYFSLYEQAPKENYEVREEPLYLPTLFPAALLTSQFLIGNGTPNCLIPSINFNDLKKFVVNYVSKGEKFVSAQNFVRLTDYDLIREDGRDKSICDLLNTGKGTIIYTPKIECKNNVITISNLYVLAKFESLYSMLEEDIKADKIDVRDESCEDFVWVIEKVKNRSFDMEALVKKIRSKFTYKENYAMYFHDEEGRVRPYSLGEIIEACYGKYKEAYEKKLSVEHDELCEQKSILVCLAEMSKHTDVVTDNTLSDKDKINMLTDIIDFPDYIIEKALQKPIRYLKNDEKAITKADKDIRANEKKSKNIADTILASIENI